MSIWAGVSLVCRFSDLVLAKRIIPCLDVTDGRVVKGVNFVDLIDAGDPVECAIANFKTQFLKRTEIIKKATCDFRIYNLRTEADPESVEELDVAECLRKALETLGKVEAVVDWRDNLRERVLRVARRQKNFFNLSGNLNYGY